MRESTSLSFKILKQVDPTVSCNIIGPLVRGRAKNDHWHIPSYICISKNPPTKNQEKNSSTLSSSTLKKHTPKTSIRSPFQPPGQSPRGVHSPPDPRSGCRSSADPFRCKSRESLQEFMGSYAPVVVSGVQNDPTHQHPTFSPLPPGLLGFLPRSLGRCRGQRPCHCRCPGAPPATCPRRSPRDR